MTGVELIAKERDRQRIKFSDAHDAKNKSGELAFAACYYALPRPIPYTRYDEEKQIKPERFFPEKWDERWANRDKSGRIRDLVKAGALIAAEIDRLTKEDPLGMAPIGSRTTLNKKLAWEYKENLKLWALTYTSEELGQKSTIAWMNYGKDNKIIGNVMDPRFVIQSEDNDPQTLAGMLEQICWCVRFPI